MERGLDSKFHSFRKDLDGSIAALKEAISQMRSECKLVVQQELDQAVQCRKCEKGCQSDGDGFP